MDYKAERMMCGGDNNAMNTSSLDKSLYEGEETRRSENLHYSWLFSAALH
jgi:hypothetical protein